MDSKWCDFCLKEVGKRLVWDKGEEWYSFVPEDPLIFGHIVLTVKKQLTDREGTCERIYRNLWAVQKGRLRNEIVGVKECMNGLLNIPHVQRVYLVVAGEEESVHHHFHLVPRYKPIWEGSDEETDRKSDKGIWLEACDLTKGKSEWKRYYRLPWDLSHWSGFQYLGELEKNYNDFKSYVAGGENPSKAKGLLEEMAGRVKTCMGFTE